jgi:FkbM family methyltransferase
MLRNTSQRLKKEAPALHQFLKSALRRSHIPAIKRLNGRFVFVAPQLVASEPTEPHVLRWIDELLRAGDTFLDTGAHYGWMSLAACQRVGPKGKVVAFEPSQPLLDLLAYHKEVNRFRQMEIVPKAVGNAHNELVRFHLVNGGESFLNSLVEHPVAEVNGKRSEIQVACVTLDNFCEEHRLRPDLVKIDVEAAELLVLQGCKRLLRERHCIFIVAIHPTWLPANQRAGEVFELFQAHGYQIARHEEVVYDGAYFGDYIFMPATRTASVVR